MHTLLGADVTALSSVRFSIDRSSLWRNNGPMKDNPTKLVDMAERLEKECSEVIRYLNDEVVPAVRQHSTKALRTAADKLEELANYMEQHSSANK